MTNATILVRRRSLFLLACCLLAFAERRDGPDTDAGAATRRHRIFKASIARQAALVTEFDVNGLKVLVKRREGSQTVASRLYIRGGVEQHHYGQRRRRSFHAQRRQRSQRRLSRAIACARNWRAWAQ